MKFKMNNITYEIKEKSQAELAEENGSKPDIMYFGLTIPSKQEIWLLETLKPEQKRITLMHELMHCYCCCYLSFSPLNFDEDYWADISANSHAIIDEIANAYFSLT